MLPRTNRLSTRDIARLFGRTTTQKIPAYPFVYFVGRHPMYKHTKWGIQLSTKLTKSAVKRHYIKRAFYDCVRDVHMSSTIPYAILAVPQKKWHDEIVQLLATGAKNTIVPLVMQQCKSSLSSLIKKIGSSVESKKQ